MTTENRPATWLDHAHAAEHQIDAAAGAMMTLARDLEAVGLDRPAKRASAIAALLTEARASVEASINRQMGDLMESVREGERQTAKFMTAILDGLATGKIVP